MARPRSNKLRNKGKGTSFGKQSDAEKSFRKRKRNPRWEDSRRSSGPSGDKMDRTVRTKPSDFRRNESSASRPTANDRHRGEEGRVRSRRTAGNDGTRSEGPPRFSK